MTSTPSLVLLAFLPSMLTMVWLAWHDPKRRRSVGWRGSDRMPSSQRFWLAGFVVLPGVVLAGAGAWTALLIWLGLLLVLGWILVQTLAWIGGR